MWYLHLYIDGKGSLYVCFVCFSKSGKLLARLITQTLLFYKTIVLTDQLL